VTDQPPHRLATTLEERLAGLESEFHRAYWDSQIDASEANERRRAELELELRRVKGDPDTLAAVNAALDEQLYDPILRRQLEVLRLSLTGNQMDEEHRARMVELSTSVEGDFASFRPEVGGRRVNDNDILDILRDSDDESLRRAAWTASKEIGSHVAERVREIVRVRNQAAHDLGYGDYYLMSLDLQELDPEWLFDLLDELATMTDGPFKKWKAELDDQLTKRFDVADLAPWHYADPFFQQLPPDGRVDLDDLFDGADAAALAEHTFASWGIDIRGVLEGSDLFPREGKCQHAFCLDVDRSGNDVRILANVVPGERWIEVMLHESGHAAYDVSIAPSLPYSVRRAAHTFVTEAIAILSGRLVRDPVWLVSIAQRDPATVESLSAQLHHANATQSLLFARWGLVMAHFERALYADPEGDLDARWYELVETFQSIPPPPKGAAKRGQWASKIHLAVAPVYYHNYLLGELLASQLRATAEGACGGFVGNDQVGPFLVDRVFRSGSLLRWDALVEEATGTGLSAADFSTYVTL
jgi:peptidyl-dipeptidase A